MDLSSVLKKLICARHPNEGITHICTVPDCQASSILFCGKCLSSEAHVTQHKKNIIRLKDFLEAQVYSLDPPIVDDLLSKTNEIEQKIKKVDDEYKKEDSQIDKDFGSLFAIFFKASESGKTMLKGALRESFTKLAERNATLRKNLETIKTNKVDHNELKKNFSQINKDNAEEQFRNFVIKRQQKYDSMSSGLTEVFSEFETAVKEKPCYKKSATNIGSFEELKQNFEKTCYNMINLLRNLIEGVNVKQIPVKKIDLIPSSASKTQASLRDSQVAKIAQDIERSRNIFAKTPLNQSTVLSRDVSQASIEFDTMSPTKKFQGLAGFPEITNPKVLEVTSKAQPIVYPEEVTTDDFIDFQTAITTYKCLELPDVSVYQGQWRNGKRHGLGRIIYIDGGIYEGTWVDDVPSGYGRVIRRNGDMYEGFIKDYKANGEGKLVTLEGYRFEGNWIDDKKHGYGEEYMENTMFMYRGDFTNGKYHGQGLLKLEDGRVFEGTFVEGKFTGKGKYFGSASEDIQEQYEGDFVNWKKHGKGVYQLSDGSRYEGDFVNDVPEGFGEFTWPDGTTFRGLWKNGKQDGLGEEIDVNGTKREGEWVEGKWKRWVK